MKKKKIVKKKKELEEVGNDSNPLDKTDSALLENPRAILDEGVSEAARTLVRASQGSEVSREELSAAQDILNRVGIISGGSKSSAIPEAFARDAFAFVFRILGFPPIKWPRAFSDKTESESITSDEFNRALQEN